MLHLPLPPGFTGARIYHSGKLFAEVTSDHEVRYYTPWGSPRQSFPAFHWYFPKGVITPQTHADVCEGDTRFHPRMVGELDE